MGKTINILARAVSGKVEVKVSLIHPMESGQRKDAKGKPIPAHFIQSVTASRNGKALATAQLGPAVAKNPTLAFRFAGGKQGEKITVEWIDNKGNKQADETTIT